MDEITLTGAVQSNVKSAESKGVGVTSRNCNRWGGESGQIGSFGEGGRPRMGISSRSSRPA